MIISNLVFPKYCKDLEFKHLMKFMLCKDLMSRIYKLKQVKLHPYMKDFDWVI